MEIRSATLDDAGAWADVVAASSPYLVQDAASTTHEMLTDPADAVRLVATTDEDGVVGLVRLRAHDDEDHASVQLMVLPDHRRRGVGRGLLDGLTEPLRAGGRTEVHAVVEDDAGSRSAAEVLGFTLTRTFRMSALDPRFVDRPAVDGRVVRLSDVEPSRVWTLHNQVVLDDPSGLSSPTLWEEWLDDWRDPRNRPDLSHGVEVDGELVAFTQLGAAGDRAWSNMTGTRTDHRGRGHALRCKHASLYAAARAGVTRCFAGNDDDNQPMVAVNTRLGYRPFANPRLGVRPLGPAGG